MDLILLSSLEIRSIKQTFLIACEAVVNTYDLVEYLNNFFYQRSVEIRFYKTYKFWNYVISTKVK